MAYRDMRETLAALEENGLLYRVKTPVNKDTELMPMVRWQFRGLPEEQRKAFLFENVYDSRGRQYDIPVVVGLLGGSRQVFACGMECETEEIMERLAAGQRNPIQPSMIGKEEAPCKQVILTGGELQGADGGLYRFPIPISTPGYDPAPFITSPYVITKDPETGIRNVGTYRMMLKGSSKTGMFMHTTQHLGRHWLKYKEMGKPMPCAVVIGTVPAIGMVSATKIPYGVDELSVAGGFMGRPVELVPCETVDLEVPAQAEIVLEGFVTTDVKEPEAPFGEFTGYMGARQMHPIFHITCITHRREPIYQAFLSQFPPSESSKLRQITFEAIYYKTLKYDCNIPAVLDVAFHESGGSRNYIVIQMKKRTPAEPWQALHAAAALDSITGKIIIAVDEDIDPREPEAVNWALSFGMQPKRDISIVEHKASMIDPSAAPPGSPEEEAIFPKPSGASAVLIDATRKWDYPPVSLPKRQFMERARELWEQEGLPPLQPRNPWYGYDLGYWSHELDEEARLAVLGEYDRIGDKLREQAKKV